MNRIALLLLVERVEHLLDALLEVAAIARAGDERAEVEREDSRVLQRLRHLALVNAQRQPFGQRGLADAGLADQQRVVLAAAAEHLDHALELELAADQRIDLPSRGLARPGRWRRPRADRAAPTPASPASGARRRRARRRRGAVRDHAQQRQPIDALLAQEVRGVAVLFLQQEHEQRAAVDLLRARRRGVHHRALDDAIEADRRFGLDGLLARHRRERALEHLVEIAAERRRGRRGSASGAARACGSSMQRVQQVLEADEIVPAIGGERNARRMLSSVSGANGTGVRLMRAAPRGSGSIVTSSGNSCCSASRCVALTLVSATSRV